MEFSKIDIIHDCLAQKYILLDYNMSLEYLGNSVDVYNVLVATFIEEYQGIYVKIMNSYNDKDYQKVYNYIHKLKGVANYIGSKLLYDYCVYILDFLKDSRYEEVSSDVSNVGRLAEIIVKQLKR